MTHFIDQLAHFIFEEKLDLSHLTIVLPSQRAKKYLQRALFQEIGKPIFSPKIITMNRWIQNLSPLPIIPSTNAVFELYGIHKRVDSADIQTIDEFLKWGTTLLNDFDEMDRYLINSRDLFKNLQEIKEIENWSFNSEEPLTEGQQRFMKFWDLLKSYYDEFNAVLDEKGLTYMGKAYKRVAEDIACVFQEDDKQTFIFAGFNALSPAETSIMKQLKTMGRAFIFVDGDDYYIQDKNHEAGRFIRQLFQELQVKSLDFVGNSLATSEKEITVINCPQPTGQVKVAATILNQLPSSEYSTTLLLLADEKLIVPIMKNIPGKVENANITLGLPLKNTALRSWVDLCFSIQEHFIYFKNDWVYHKDFIRFLKHPFILAFANNKEKAAFSSLEKQILSYNKMFINWKEIEISERFLSLLEALFLPWQRPFSLATFLQLNRIIFEGITNEKNAIERSIIYHFDKSIRILQQTLSAFEEDIKDAKLSTFKTIFNQHWMRENIAYYGNPLEGLQVMGLLETRLIDFKNVVVVGLNEGSMPPTNPIQTLVPMDLRKYHGLPTPREKQGLFAHHFYRLLHHASRCWITYSSSDRELGGVDEPSRYIMQLELEYARKNPNVQWKSYDYQIENTKEDTQTLSIAKDAVIFQRLDEYFENKTSASALKTALRCPLDFYYKYLLGLGEEEKVEEDIEASSFGSIVHEVLEGFYKPFETINNVQNSSKPVPVTAVHIENMLETLHDKISLSFKENFSTHTIEGKNYLSLELAEHLTKRLLKKEKKRLKEEKIHAYIIATELEIEKTLQLSIHGKTKTVRFTGFLDRIDEINGEKRIIDYKTGTCTPYDVSISGSSKSELQREEKIVKLTGQLKTKKYLLQLLIYNMLYFEKFKSYPTKTGIVSLVNINDIPFFLTNNLTETMEELMDLFTEALTQIIEALYDTAVPLEHDKSSNYCDYC